jgi:2-keto-4-pentenoate hydratase/2-oxohepta-3-ene-1,7-dioic acid hydratase in catechol pathway
MANGTSHDQVSARLIPDPNNLSIRTTVNGNVMQDSNTSQMVFGVKDIIAFCSQGTTLRPGMDAKTSLCDQR